MTRVKKLTKQMGTLAVIAPIVGCDQYVLAAWIERRELHVDSAAPSALAMARIEVGLDNFQHERPVRMRRAAMSSPQGSMELPLEFPGDSVQVPVTGSQVYALENRGMTNASLAIYCQTVRGLTIEIEFPDDIDGQTTSMSLDDELVVFCP